MGSLRDHEGYLSIDNRLSPGVDAEIIRQSGKAAPVVGEGQHWESATATCAHCGTLVVLNPDRTRPRGYCRSCDAYVCDSPACADCRPFAKLLEELQDAAYHLGIRGLTLDDSGLLVPRR
jgi:hypothetical protein